MLIVTIKWLKSLQFEMVVSLVGVWWSIVCGVRVVRKVAMASHGVVEGRSSASLYGSNSTLTDNRV